MSPREEPRYHGLVDTLGNYLVDSAVVGRWVGKPGQWGEDDQRGPLDVSLHDSDLHQELQLTNALIIAANELGEGRSLSPERIDQHLRRASDRGARYDD